MKKISLDRIVERAKKSNWFIAISIVIVLLSSLITISQGINLLYDYYNRSLGYKSQLLDKITLLSADVHIDYFKDLIGASVFIDEVEGDMIEYIFVHDFFYVQAFTNSKNKVIAYSVTTRSKDFNPELTLGPYSVDNNAVTVKLGITKFSELNKLDTKPGDIFTYLGAHTFYYSEEYYFGNPGNYQTFYFTLNQSGYMGIEYESDKFFEYPPYLGDKEVSINDPEIKQFRENAIINTYTVSSTSELFHRDFIGSLECGPHYHTVRVLPK